MTSAAIPTGITIAVLAVLAATDAPAVYVPIISDTVALGILTAITGMFGVFMAYQTSKLNKIDRTTDKSHNLLNQHSLTLARLRVSTSERLGDSPEDIKEKTEAAEALKKKQAEQDAIDAVELAKI